LKNKFFRACPAEFVRACASQFRLYQAIFGVSGRCRFFRHFTCIFDIQEGLKSETTQGVAPEENHTAPHLWAKK
jgi:hypothetical protein